MSDAINLLKRAESLETAPEQPGYSGVRIYCGQDSDGEDIVYFAGDETGSVLEVKNDLGTQAMADNILARVKGFKYQPMTVSGALLDPSAEMGDGISVNGEYSGIFTKKTKYDALITSDVSAPFPEEIEHEFSVESPTDRSYSRKMSSIRSSLSINASQIAAEVQARTDADEQMESQLLIQASEISAKVSKNGGSGGFSWSLTDSAWTVYSGNQAIFNVDSGGASVKGVITATSGMIGGFNIGQNSIYNGISRFGGTASNGVYLGTDGIQLGQGFKVNPSGQATFSGNVTINGKEFSASSFQGGVQGGGHWSGGKGTSSRNITCDTDTLQIKNIDCTNKLDCDGEGTFQSCNADQMYSNDAVFDNLTLHDFSQRKDRPMKGFAVVLDKAGYERIVPYFG